MINVYEKSLYYINKLLFTTQMPICQANAVLIIIQEKSPSLKLIPT